MMKKRVMSMLMVMIMMVSMLSVSVFAAHDGACTAATDWSKNEDAHWHACVTDGCEVTDVTALPDYAAHTFDNTHKCTVCGYQGTHKWFENADEAICTCGAEHTHVLTYVNTDATNHWQVCSGCAVDAAKKFNEAAHTMVENGSVNECSVCGYSEPIVVEHTHVWATTPTWDADHHWYECTDASCSEINSKGIHWDYDNNNDCDFGDCAAAVPGKHFSTLTITGLTEPAEGAAVDFNINIAEVGYDMPLVTVSWNRITHLAKGTSVALGENATFVADNMYNVGLVIPVTWNDTIDSNLKVTLNGKEVPFYGKEAFAAAQKTYEGNNTVYMAKVDKVNGRQCIVVGAMYAKIGGTHVCTYTSDWIETPAKHYYMCTGCNTTKDAEFHYDNNKSGLCDVCGFDMKYFNKNATATNGGTGTAGHTHSYSTDWVEDISNHWKQCTGCGAKTQQAAHADLNNTGKCDVCGFVMTAAAGHTHTFSADWTETFAQHYKVCECGAKNEIAAHVDLNNTGKCDTCGYAMTTLSNNGIVADTGDDNATFLWMAAFAIAVMGFGATVVVSRKKREE